VLRACLNADSRLRQLRVITIDYNILKKAMLLFAERFSGPALLRRPAPHHVLCWFDEQK